MAQAPEQPTVSQPATLLDNSITGGGSQTGQPSPDGVPLASATLEQCVTAVDRGERSAVFSGEMTAISGGVRMAMRIDLQVQLPGEAQFHTITLPGLGVWRSSGSGVTTYRQLRQVTDLSAPAAYRAAVSFRWLNGKGRAIKVLARRSPRCEQPAPPPTPAGTIPASSATAYAPSTGSR
jgi:hypothetical protein